MRSRYYAGCERFTNLSLNVNHQNKVHIAFDDDQSEGRALDIKYASGLKIIYWEK